MLREEKTVGQLAAEYGAHNNMLYRWRVQALAGLPGLWSRPGRPGTGARCEAAWQQEQEAIYAEIGRLPTQVTWVEKNLAQVLSREERRKLVDWENRELPVSTQAERLAPQSLRALLSASATITERGGSQAPHRRDLYGPLLLRLSAHCGTTPSGRAADQSKNGGTLYAGDETGSSLSRPPSQ